MINLIKRLFKKKLRDVPVIVVQDAPIQFSALAAMYSEEELQMGIILELRGRHYFIQEV